MCVCDNPASKGFHLTVHLQYNIISAGGSGRPGRHCPTKTFPVCRDIWIGDAQSTYLQTLLVTSCNRCTWFVFEMIYLIPYSTTQCLDGQGPSREPHFEHRDYFSACAHESPWESGLIEATYLVLQPLRQVARLPRSIESPPMSLHFGVCAFGSGLLWFS